MADRNLSPHASGVNPRDRFVPRRGYRPMLARCVLITLAMIGGFSTVVVVAVAAGAHGEILAALFWGAMVIIFPFALMDWGWRRV